MSGRKRYKCRECGSTDLRFDAVTTWNEASQAMELDHTFDNVTCQECGLECNHPDADELEAPVVKARVCVNVVCTAEIEIERRAASEGEFIEIARDVAEATPSDRWRIDVDGSWDWGSMQFEFLEAPEGNRCPHGLFYSGAGGCPQCSSTD